VAVTVAESWQQDTAEKPLFSIGKSGPCGGKCGDFGDVAGSGDERKSTCELISNGAIYIDCSIKIQ
jgi:hypothetical protein